ncbi:MAG: hypothetical protein JXB13_01975 [Phycisphaerae bacterium]|nr:hypothetical protein [Phycisphaerae bacterium]
MRVLKLHRDQVPRVIAALEEGGPFAVLDKMVYGHEAAAFALRGSTWKTLGHFDRTAFCAVIVTEDNEAELRITHLNVPRAWHGRNIFERFDRRIEDQIHDYVLGRL